MSRQICVVLVWLLLFKVLPTRYYMSVHDMQLGQFVYLVSIETFNFRTDRKLNKFHHDSTTICNQLLTFTQQMFTSILFDKKKCQCAFQPAVNRQLALDGPGKQSTGQRLIVGTVQISTTADFLILQCSHTHTHTHTFNIDLLFVLRASALLALK